MAEPGSPDQPAYEVYAIKCAEADALPPGKVAISADPHVSPFDMTYDVWLIRRADTAIVVDTGFDACSIAKRSQLVLRSPADGLRALGVDPQAVLILLRCVLNGCGRDVGFPTPPAQIRTCGTIAYGSCIES